MSEIYNGTFLLGNTSATTLSAGPGIKLDTSVPGVIGISNDETLLWSGARNASNITLNEVATNFEYLKFTVADPNDEFRQINEFPADSRMNSLTMLQSFTSASQIFRSTKISTSDYLTYYMSEEQRTRFVSNNTIDWAVGYGAGVVKVVGINRISGGN